MTQSCLVVSLFNIRPDNPVLIQVLWRHPLVLQQHPHSEVSRAIYKWNYLVWVIVMFCDEKMALQEELQWSKPRYPEEPDPVLTPFDYLPLRCKQLIYVHSSIYSGESL